MIADDGSILYSSETLQKAQKNGLYFELEPTWNECGGGFKEGEKFDEVRCLFDGFISVFLTETCVDNSYRPLPAMLGDGRCVDLFKLFLVVREKGGYESVSKNGLWDLVVEESGFGRRRIASAVKLIYTKYLAVMERWLERGLRDKKSGSGLRGSDSDAFLMQLEEELNNFLSGIGIADENKKAWCPPLDLTHGHNFTYAGSRNCEEVLFARGNVCKVASELHGLVCADISKGKEDICIPVTNLFDFPPVAPVGFTYSKSIRVAENVKLPSPAPGCKCKGICTNPEKCSCARLNGSDFPYVAKNGGRLIEAQDVVYECGPNCGCGPSCVNRTSQRGPKYRLEVFRTASKGWAVRSWDSIPSGAPVCEYIGVLKRCDDLDNVSENDYIFEIDLLQTIKEIGGRERRLRGVSVPTSNLLDMGTESAPEYCLDAGSIGNVARFINHSCEPNLFVQCVFSSYHDARFARVVLIAAENIPPLQELTYDYNYALDSVMGTDGKIKKLPCHCGVASCRMRLY